MIEDKVNEDLQLMPIDHIYTTVNKISHFKILEYLKNHFALEHFKLYVVDDFAMKLVDRNNDKLYFRYDSQTKKVVWFNDNIDNFTK